MCGIFGCISNDAADLVLEGLRKLEYRGYDSSGLAALFPKRNGPIETERTTGYVSDLVSKANGRFKGSNIAIGHTRWATHGGVSEKNAHPHSSNDGRITIVHNGIIENAPELRNRVEKMGYSLDSETDSEVIVHLLDYELNENSSDYSPLEAFSRVIDKLEGSWAIAAILNGLEGILVARNGAPLILGRGRGNICVSSDIVSFYGRCPEVAYMNDGDVFLIKSNSVSSSDGSTIPPFEQLEGTLELEEKGNFPHFMLKEIHDQPISISNALGGRISSDGKTAKLQGFSLSPGRIKKLNRINLVACGTAFFAAEIGVFYLRKLTNLNVEAFRASEFPHEIVGGTNTLTIGISQSGETKDTLDALQLAKISGGNIASICNVIGSTIARYTGNGAYLHAGPEFAVASTKAFTNMVAILMLLAITLADRPTSYISEVVQELRTIPNKVSSQLLDGDTPLNEAVKILCKAQSAIFVGRGVSSSLVHEAALKMMEVAYLPCLAYPGGELKHGPIALIEDGLPIIAVAPDDESLSLMESTIRECKARGGKVILISNSESTITKFADVFIPTQNTTHHLSPLIDIIPLQKLAYLLAVEKGTDIDRPRNLAKSVTVV